MISRIKQGLKDFFDDPNNGDRWIGYACWFGLGVLLGLTLGTPW
jgi:hypothetical protein